MSTKSVYKTFECVRSNMPQKKFIPPWCSSSAGYIVYILPGKVGRRTKRFEVTERSRPLREHVYRHYPECKVRKAEKRSWKCTIIVIISFIIAGLVASPWMYNKLPSADLITKVIPSSKFATLLYANQSARVNRACRDRIKHLLFEYTKMQYHLKNIMRGRRATIFAFVGKDDAPKGITYNYIEGVTAMKGGDTEEWRGRLALWGIVPLWRASPPINIILALRKPVPSDCWPFTGSYGEILLHLEYTQNVNGISIEHIQPDTARSAPKNFSVYGILQNDTEIKLMDAQYRSRGPAKQYFQVKSKAAYKSILLRILSNQGNAKYTCVYRVHIYGENI